MAPQGVMDQDDTFQHGVDVEDPEYMQQPLLDTVLSAKSQQEQETTHAPWSTVFSRISRMAGPLIISNVFSYALSVIAAIAVGHLNDPTIFSAVVLAGSFYNVTGLSLIVGLSAGCDTIAGQAYGAKRYLVVGETLQRAVTICCTLCIPVLLLWWHAGPLMLALHQEPDIVAGAARYLWLVSPSLLCSSVSGNINRYLVVQRVVAPGSWCTAATALVCPLYNWLFIYRWNLGIVGAAAAFNASNLTYTSLMIGVVVWHASRMRGSPQQTWPGLSARAALSNWVQYLKYGLPAAAMLVCEWWVFELVILMAGSLRDADVAVAVMGIMFHITCIFFMLPMSVGTACNTCIANELGARHAATAQAFFRAGVSIVLCIQVVVSSGLWFGGSKVAQLFTSAPEVIAMAEHTMPMVALCVMFDGLNCMLSATLRGCGRQAWGAALNLIGYWLLGFPLALLLGFKLGLSTWGFWAALAVASSSQACIQLTFISRLDWQQEVARAAALLAAHDVQSDDEAGGDCNGGYRRVPQEDAEQGTAVISTRRLHGEKLQARRSEAGANAVSGPVAAAPGRPAATMEAQAASRSRSDVTSPADIARRASVDVGGGQVVSQLAARRSVSGSGYMAEAKRAWLVGSAAEAGRHCNVGAVLSAQQASLDLGSQASVRSQLSGHSP